MNHIEDDDLKKEADKLAESMIFYLEEKDTNDVVKYLASCILVAYYSKIICEDK